MGKTSLVKIDGQKKYSKELKIVHKKKTINNLKIKKKKNKLQCKKINENDMKLKVKKKNEKSKELTLYKQVKQVADDNNDDCLIVNNINPIKEANRVFKWLIYPTKETGFLKNNWEKRCIHIPRKNKNYYQDLISTMMLDSVLRKCNVLYGKNLDITSYTNGERETHNPTGRALPTVVWDYYLNGCSVRMLNPQEYFPKVHSLNAKLQEYFGCFVGANVYLTPPGSQGFAPHYDDIEAFILQVEGKKRWRLYYPRNESQVLPRYSSGNFKQSEIGKPFLDVILKEGDVLYFPRGIIHQGETLEDIHSLHLTISVYQKNSWGDFMEKLIPQTLTKAINSDVEFRKGLPLDYLNLIGFAFNDQLSGKDYRKKFIEKTKKLMHKLIDFIDVDTAADLMAKQLNHDLLPPALHSKELKCSALSDGEIIVNLPGIVENRVEIDLDTKIRLIRAHCVRLVKEENSDILLYYSCENSKQYHEYEQQFLEIDSEFVDAVKKIISTYPNFIKVDDLPIEGEDKKVQVVRDLWERCIVLTETLLPIID